MCKKNWLRGVRTISLQAKALPGASILRTLIIRPPMISTLTISTRLVSAHLISTRMILGIGTLVSHIVRQSANLVPQWGIGDHARMPARALQREGSTRGDQDRRRIGLMPRQTSCPNGA